MCLQFTFLENNVSKGEIACKEQFLLFLQTFPLIQPFPKQQILDSSKLNEFADDNFEFYINGRKFSKQVENNLGKGDIAPFPTLFFKWCVL